MTKDGVMMANSTWAQQFLESMSQDPAGLADYRRPIIEYNDVDPASEEALFDVGLNALAHTYTRKALAHLEPLWSIAGSPVEKAMLLALCVVANEAGTNVRYRYRERTLGDYTEMPDVLTVEPQARLGRYRVDFMLTYEAWFPGTEKLKDGRVQAEPVKITNQLIIECDGHDFHDRTKEQASDDRERDRELKKVGFDVFRYTGSDVWKSPFACAREAIAQVSCVTPDRLQDA